MWASLSQRAALARVRLKQDLARHLAKDFRVHGAAAIAKLRAQKPLDYLRLVTTELLSGDVVEALETARLAPDDEAI